MELFDNGAGRLLTPGLFDGWCQHPHRGQNNVYDRLLVHDGGQTSST
jgi:hypothetical protein